MRDEQLVIYYEGAEVIYELLAMNNKTLVSSYESWVILIEIGVMSNNWIKISDVFCLLGDGW